MLIHVLIKRIIVGDVDAPHVLLWKESDFFQQRPPILFFALGSILVDCDTPPRSMLHFFVNRLVADLFSTTQKDEIIHVQTVPGDQQSALKSTIIQTLIDSGLKQDHPE